MKIGILGGTFDPIHKAHIYMAKETLKQLKLDKVYIMPSPCPPHKNIKNPFPAYSSAILWSWR